MRLMWQYTSGRQKKLVMQALKLNSHAEAEKSGWKKIGSGATCTAFSKQNIVVKFYSSKHYVNKTLEFYLKVAKHDRKFFTRILAHDDSKIVQVKAEKAPHPNKWSDDQLKKIENISYKYSMCDVSQFWNVGWLNNNPTIFDLSHETFPKKLRKPR